MLCVDYNGKFDLNYRIDKTIIRMIKKKIVTELRIWNCEIVSQTNLFQRCIILYTNEC